MPRLTGQAVRFWAAAALAACLGIGLGCKTRDLKAAGDACTATSECEEGLTCDFGQDPPVCASGQSGDGDNDAAPADGSPVDAPPADAGIDAS